MTENKKLKLLHFETAGDIIPDFINARLKKSSALRARVRACFYLQSLCAIAGIVTGIALGGSMLNAVFAAVSGVAVIVVAFFAVGGGSAEKTISYIMNMVYAVVCFLLGGTGMYLCGGCMLLAALAALVSFFTDYSRRWLMSYSPLDIRKEHYTLTKPQEQPELQPKLTPPEPQRSELMEVAEAFAEILK